MNQPETAYLSLYVRQTNCDYSTLSLRATLKNLAEFLPGCLRLAKGVDATLIVDHSRSPWNAQRGDLW